jgi:hypothetical protein
MAVIHQTHVKPTKLELLTAWLPTRPWYHGPAEPELARAGGFRLDDPGGEVGIEFMVVTDALTIAEDIGNPGQQARAHTGLAETHLARADTTTAAIHHYERALALYTEHGMPEADAVRTRLATVTGPAGGSGTRATSG